MASSIEQVDLWRKASSESQNLEFKEATRGFDSRKLAEYCVAIANEGGGFILLGVSASRLVPSLEAKHFLI